MKKTKTIKVWIYTTEFESSDYTDIYNCALHKALTREGYIVVAVGGFSVELEGGLNYEINPIHADIISGRCGECRATPLEVILKLIESKA